MTTQHKQSLEMLQKHFCKKHQDNYCVAGRFIEVKQFPEPFNKEEYRPTYERMLNNLVLCAQTMTTQQLCAKFPFLKADAIDSILFIFEQNNLLDTQRVRGVRKLTLNQQAELINLYKDGEDVLHIADLINCSIKDVSEALQDLIFIGVIPCNNKNKIHVVEEEQNKSSHKNPINLFTLYNIDRQQFIQDYNALNNSKHLHNLYKKNCPQLTHQDIKLMLTQCDVPGTHYARDRFVQELAIEHLYERYKQWNINDLCKKYNICYNTAYNLLNHAKEKYERGREIL